MSGAGALAMAAAPLAAPLLAHAGAHGGGFTGSTPGVFNVWDAAGLAGTAALGIGYAIGLARLWRRPGGRKAVSGWSVAAATVGWLALVAGLGPPLALLADLRFAAHMGQHELLMMVAAPLLALGQPLLMLLWALPATARERVGEWAREPRVVAGWHRLTGPITVLVVQFLVLWTWHLPVAFEAALHHDGLHAFQHLTFFLAAALFWWSLVHGRFGRAGYGAGVLVVFVTALHCGLLGALITVAGQPLYATHAARDIAQHVDPLADQELAGLLMWIPAGVALLVGALALFAAWLGATGRRGEHTTAGRLTRELRERDAAQRAGAARALLLVVGLAPLALTLAGCLRRDVPLAANEVGFAARGKRAIGVYGCQTCHTIPGVPGARAQVGPSLAGIGGRMVIAGHLQNSPHNLEHWIQHPQHVNPGTLMPEMGVTPKDARDIAAYLLTLQ